MAKKRYDVCVGQQGKDEKIYWKQIGVVLQTEKGFSLKLESVPVGWDGWATLFEPKPKEERQAKPQAGSISRTEDGDVPF